MNTDDALNLLVKYNGYSDYVKSIINHINGFQGKPVVCPDWLREPDTVVGWLWFILVCRFGDYGTSPRFGWIEDRDGAIRFLERLMEDEAA